MWRLYGVYDLGYGQGSSDSIVADFSQLCLAQDYLRRSRLVKPVHGRPFRKISLLAHYHDAFIEWVDLDLPIDPVLGEKD